MKELEKKVKDLELTVGIIGISLIFALGVLFGIFL